MDIALLVDTFWHMSRAGEIVSRPFGDSTLLDICLSGLAALDAPCRKYVVAADRSTQAHAARYPELEVVRVRPHARTVQRGLARRYSYLESLGEQWFLEVNPMWPLVHPEVWWSAVEAHLAEDGPGLVSVSRLRGRFHVDDSGEGRGSAEGSVLLETDAFRIFSKQVIFGEGSYFGASDAAPIPFPVPREADWQVKDSRGFAATEAVWAHCRLERPLALV